MTNSSRKRVATEVVIVFALSLGASAFYSVLSLLAKITSPQGLAGQTATINRPLADREWLDLSYQLLGIVFGLAPVALVLFLLWEKRSSGFQKVGLNFESPAKDIRRGTALAAVIGIPGLGLYLLGRELGLAARVVPSELDGYWWSIPILVLAAMKASLLEEVVVVAYLQGRMLDLKLRILNRVLVSSLIRASYHLYQGFAGFVGNFVMGLLFSYLYERWGRVMPLVVAHFLLDIAAFVGYFLIRDFIAIP